MTCDFTMSENVCFSSQKIFSEILRLSTPHNIWTTTGYPRNWDFTPRRRKGQNLWIESESAEIIMSWFITKTLSFRPVGVTTHRIKISIHQPNNCERKTSHWKLSKYTFFLWGKWSETNKSFPLAVYCFIVIEKVFNYHSSLSPGQ